MRRNGKPVTQKTRDEDTVACEPTTIALRTQIIIAALWSGRMPNAVASYLANWKRPSVERSFVRKQKDEDYTERPQRTREAEAAPTAGGMRR